MLVSLPHLHQWVNIVPAAALPRDDVRDEVKQARGIRACRQHALLGAAHLCRRDEFHRAGDSLRAGDAADSLSNLSCIWHDALSSRY